MAAGVPLEVLPGGSWPSRVRALRAKVVREQPDLVHATLVSSCLASRMALVRLDPPLLNSVVNTSHDPTRGDRVAIASWKLRALRAVDGVTARHLVDHVHALTDAVAEEVEDVLGVDPGRITVIPRGRSQSAVGSADLVRRARVRRDLDLEQIAPVVVNVGRQDGQKAQADLVRAFARLVRARPDAVLLIAGREGSATPELLAAIDEEGVGSSVRLLGHRTDVLDVVAAADVFAFPSHYEGLGCSLIEAMALGVPIVGSDARAIAEVLGDGAYGRVVPRGDGVALADAMDGLLEDRVGAEALAERAHRRFLEHYELETIADATADLYARVVAEGRTRR